MKIAVIGTLDTKGIEVDFLKNEVMKRGATPLVIDPGVLGKPAIEANVTREMIARASGEELDSLINNRDKAYIQDTMILGLVQVVSRLYEEGNLDGVVALGGAQGTATATAAMRALPVGIPKIMVSTVACGKTAFGPYVGTKDILMFHAVADILGLNLVTRTILAQAAAAVVAMSSISLDVSGKKELIAITQAGITTTGVMAVKEELEKLGFEVIAFHCNGIGGQAMEDLIYQGVVKGVIDFSPHEITDLLFDGLMPALPGRLSIAGKVGIPQVVTPGATDIRLHGVLDDLPNELRQRACVRHTPTHTHVRTSSIEMQAVAHYIAKALNEAKGPRAVLIPLLGFSMFNRQGEILYDEQSNMAFVEVIRAELSPDVRLYEVDAHINDPKFAKVTVETFLSLRKSLLGINGELVT